MLEKELQSVAALRKDGYTPSEAGGGNVEVHRGESSKRDQRIRFPYEIVVKSGDTTTVRDADVELSQRPRGVEGGPPRPQAALRTLSGHPGERPRAPPDDH